MQAINGRAAPLGVWASVKVRVGASPMGVMLRLIARRGAFQVILKRPKTSIKRGGAVWLAKVRLEAVGFVGDDNVQRCLTRMMCSVQCPVMTRSREGHLR
jgi:hypothetical protein